MLGDPRTVNESKPALRTPLSRRLFKGLDSHDWLEMFPQKMHLQMIRDGFCAFIEPKTEGAILDATPPALQLPYRRSSPALFHSTISLRNMPDHVFDVQRGLKPWFVFYLLKSVRFQVG